MPNRAVHIANTPLAVENGEIVTVFQIQHDDIQRYRAPDAPKVPTEWRTSGASYFGLYRLPGYIESENGFLHLEDGLEALAIVRNPERMVKDVHNVRRNPGRIHHFRLVKRERWERLTVLED
jgi:hypothetical protein